MGRKRRGIQPRGRSIRIDFEYQGQRCRETLSIPPTPKNLDYAENKRGQILTEIQLGSFDYAKHFPDSPRAQLGAARQAMTLSKACDNWMRTRVVTETTRRVYRNYIRRYVDAHELGPRAIASILASELEIWRADHAAKLSPKTVNNALIILRGAFELAHADGVVRVDPAARLQNVGKARRSEADPFTPAELGALLAVMPDQERNMVDFWWSGGGYRHGEIFALEWPDIDWIQRRTHVWRSMVEKKEIETKTKRERFVYWKDRAETALRRQRAHTQLQGGKIFRHSRTGKPWIHQQQFLEFFARACKRAGVRYRPPKQLRHTYASMALSTGEPPLFVMEQLGHTTLSMLEQHYAKWMPSANTSAGSGFDRLAATVGQ